MDIESVMLVPGQMMLNEKQELTMYMLTKWQIAYNNPQKTEEGIKMVIVLKRRITNELLTTYLPSILLILITYATTFFPSFYFEAAVTVNLTTMLVMTTLFIAVMDKLPSTAYVKAIDVWLIFGQLIPFISVVTLSLKEVFRTKEGDKDGNVDTNHHGANRKIRVNTIIDNEEETGMGKIGTMNIERILLLLDFFGRFLPLLHVVA